MGRYAMAAAMTVPTPNDRYWEERAQLMEREALPSVRKAAENWRTGILGLTSFVGIAGSIIGLVVVPEGELARSGIVPAAAALAGCFAFLIIASWLAMSASYGHPKQVYTAGTALREWSRTEANSAAAKLSWSRRSAAIGLLLLLVGATLLMVLPRAESSRPMKATNTKGQEFCGTVTANSSGEFLITSEDGTVHTIAARTLEKASFPDSC